MNKMIAATAMTVCMATSGCAVGIQLATSTVVGFAHAQRMSKTVNMIQQPNGVYEVMQDIVSGKGILINGEYSPTPGITGATIDTFA